MSSSSFSSPPTPRFRPTDSAEEPLIHARHDPSSSPERKPQQHWLARPRTILLLSVALSLCVWGLLTLPSLSAYRARIPTKPAVLDVDAITSINATLLAPAAGSSSNTTKWTIAIPAIPAPLRPAVYRGICRSAHEVSAHAAAAATGGGGHHGDEGGGGGGGGHHAYYWFDRLFVDPADTDAPPAVPDGQEMCDASLTYLLETKNAGFGASLMGLWSAYGLAKKEGRAFFVDDRDWPWGKYTSYFTPAPSAGCVPPPHNWLLPCPHHAKHLVVSAATHGFVFGHAFADEFEDPRKMGALRQARIFELVRTGYEALFRLGVRKDDLSAVEDRKHSLSGAGAGGTAATVLHVRRGDKVAVDWAFKAGYVPLANYVQAAADLATVGGSGGGKVVYASDDAAVYDSVEFSGFEAAERGELQREPGGFTADAFWGMPLAQRELVGRGYVRDLKILGELAAKRGGGGAACDGASVTCRLIAVIMGWERAIVQKRWRNVDGGYDWSGVDW